MEYCHGKFAKDVLSPVPGLQNREIQVPQAVKNDYNCNIQDYNVPQRRCQGSLMPFCEYVF